MGFSTASLPPRDQLAYFREEMAQRFGIGDVSAPPAPRFRADLEVASLAGIGLVEVAADPLTIERTARDVARAQRDSFTVGLVLEGACVLEQGGREARLGAFDLVLCDSRRPFRIRFDGPFRQLLVDVHAPQLAARLPGAERLTALRIDGRRGVASVTTALVRAICGQAPGLGAAGQAVAEHTLDLLALALGGDAPRPAGEQLLRARVDAYIELHLADPDLTPQRIAHENGISRRYLYRLFEAEGPTVCDRIRRRRLERCRAALLDPRQSARTVSEIALAWGFNDLSHFSHAFRDAFGCAPRDYRRAASPS